ncbi:MAG: AAA family ATPase, partial [Rhodoferax sp.]|nr:AAA family ATPase [Rhodoferax sp.]
MESRSLVPQSSPFHLPVAQMRRVFQPDEVERKLAKLQEHEHDSLRATYRRMLERGPQRFQVKPSGVPDMA